MVEIKKKDVNDLVIYLQKTYGLYFVEFREAPNKRKEIVMCNPNNKKWWIAILLHEFNKASVFPALTDDIPQYKIEDDIRHRRYKGYGKKYDGKWLRL